MRHTTKQPARTLPLVRCGVYTRKSTEEGLEQEFNSLDAQREAGEAFVTSQQGEGWRCLPDRYDDGGFTGGNMDRPALQRLMADIEAGKIDCVVVYKVDRLSRSLLDFAQMMQTFEKYKVSFVSVTQQFNTATSMGRLILNVLLSFAQFEREIISERTRDKIAATRRKGKWAGGHPVLGYDLQQHGARQRLVVNEDEAVRVRAIFDLYLQHESLLPVVLELEKRGWLNKRWMTKAGRERGGERFTRTNLHRLLTNVLYIGKVRYKDEVHQGEHPAIVDPAVWQRVQAILERNGQSGGAPVRNKFGALLKGLIRCVPCDCAMTPTHTTREGGKRYRYYVCSNAQKVGWHACPSKAIPAAEIERLVVEQVKCIGSDPALARQTAAQARLQDQQRLAELEAERRSLEKDLVRWRAEVTSLSGQLGSAADPAAVISRLAEVQGRVEMAERRSARALEGLHAARQALVDEQEVAHSLARFDPVWEALPSREQGQVLRLLVERIDYDGREGAVSITFHPTGIKALADRLAGEQQEQTA
jgi:site-specific DNA recombinase